MMKLARLGVLLVVLMLAVTACTSVAQVGGNGGGPNNPPNPPDDPPEVCAINVDTGEMHHTKSRKKDLRDIPGNLIFHDGDVLSQNLWAVSAYPQLQVKLAEMLYNGDGTARDQAQALVWLDRAAAAGNERAISLKAWITRAKPAVK